MSKHLFGMILTHQGTYANNRGENEGNTSTLQKVLRNGELYTTVSAESIRHALREGWQFENIVLNRTMTNHRACKFEDRDFSRWYKYLDNDVLGFMNAQKEPVSRRGILEITRAISTTPWRGEIMHNFAAPGSNPVLSGNDPIPYAVEVHDTRYQFGFAMTPEFLGRDGNSTEDRLTAGEKRERLRRVLEGFVNLRRVGGNHARYLADYSPEAIVLRWTDDPVPRFLYCFEQDERGGVGVAPLLARVNGGDIDGNELVIGAALKIPELGGASAGSLHLSRMEREDDLPRPPWKDKVHPTLAGTGAIIQPGVKIAVEILLDRIKDWELCPG